MDFQGLHQIVLIKGVRILIRFIKSLCFREIKRSLGQPIFKYVMISHIMQIPLKIMLLRSVTTLIIILIECNLTSAIFQVIHGVFSVLYNINLMTHCMGVSYTHIIICMFRSFLLMFNTSQHFVCMLREI